MLQSFRSFVVLSMVLISFLPLVARADASVAIQSLTPGTTVAVGTSMSFIVVNSGFSAAVTYSVSDSKSGSSVTNANINSSGVFSWIPSANDIGDHAITITVDDGVGNTMQVTQGITVPAAPAVSIQNLSASSVYVQSTVFFNAIATGFTNPHFSTLDSASVSSVGINTINQNGGVAWTPQEQDIGSHTITVTVTDSLGHVATANVSITVNPPASLTITPAMATSTTMYPGTVLTFTLTPSSDFSSPTFSVSDALQGSSLNGYALNPYTGVLTWTPRDNDLGQHVLTFTAQDSSNHHATTLLTVNIIASTTPSSSLYSVKPYMGPTNVFATTTAIGKSLPSLPNMPNTNVPDIHLKFYFTNNMAVGSSGDDVTELQNALKQLGFYSGPISGTFGPLTKTAVMAFQTANKLEPVGNVGPMTRAVLNKANTSTAESLPVETPAPSTSISSGSFTFTAVLSLGSRGAEVTELQKRLISLKLLAGEPTGYFGQLTFAAVKAYQTSKGLEPVGSLGPKTRATLNAGN